MMAGGSAGVEWARRFAFCPQEIKNHPSRTLFLDNKSLSFYRPTSTLENRLFSFATMSSNTGYNSNKNSRTYKNAPQPCRGFPAIFFTCESGREKKCQREALELIHHYYYISKSNSADTQTSLNDMATITADGKHPDDQLSLDEELKMLRKGAAAEEVLSYERNSKRPRYEAKNARSMKSPFIAHNIGVKGIICIVFALPGSELIPYNDIVMALRPKGEGDAEDDSKKEVITDEVNNEKDSGNEANKSHLWDPIETVRIILNEVGRTESDAGGSSDHKEAGQSNVTEQAVSTSPPGSRFISRMIPIQATVSSLISFFNAAILSKMMDITQISL